MGYDVIEHRMMARLERHNGPGDAADDAAFERFKAEVRALIDADPDYTRIFNYGARYAVLVAP